jgi:hypothetical protein
MAREQTIRILDDIDGSPDAATILFGLDDQSYEIDLSVRNEVRLREILSPYIEVATKVRKEPVRGKGRGRATVTRPAGDKERNLALRAWSIENGIELPGRGRIAAAVLTAYETRDVDALYAAVGVEREVEVVEEEKPKRSRRSRATDVLFREAV